MQVKFNEKKVATILRALIGKCHQIKSNAYRLLHFIDPNTKAFNRLFVAEDVFD